MKFISTFGALVFLSCAQAVHKIASSNVVIHLFKLFLDSSNLWNPVRLASWAKLVLIGIRVDLFAFTILLLVFLFDISRSSRLKLLNFVFV